LFFEINCNTKSNFVTQMEYSTFIDKISKI